jgi:ribosomal protein S18 acetylase RimI-like enzyme
MKIAIEQLELVELKSFLRKQADDAFPDLKDEHRLNMLSEKWNTYAKFCTCRNNENRLVGIIAFYANQPNGGVVYIPHVYVNSEFRGNNIMSSMMKKIIEYVKGKGFQYLKLEVNKNNQIAQTAYLRYGFKFAGDATVASAFMVYTI